MVTLGICSSQVGWNLEEYKLQAAKSSSTVEPLLSYHNDSSLNGTVYLDFAACTLSTNLQTVILCFSEQLSREKAAQAMGVGLKHSNNNRLWLTVYTRSFVSCPILSASALALWITVVKITIT